MLVFMFTYNLTNKLGLNMFKFGFSEDKSLEDKEIKEEKIIEWFPAEIIEISEDQISKLPEEENTFHVAFTDVNLQLIRSDDVALNCKNENIIKAETEHSDLLPAIYEGGLKIWECTHDLTQYLITQGINLKGKRILDLGCGTGLLGIIALLEGSVVHFQDYNSEVIKSITIPNVLLNSTNHELVKENTRFYSGDWAAFTELFTHKNPLEEEKYDVILSSETIYNPENHEKLYQVFKECLKTNGIGYIAGKTYYFGVGGGMRQFENVVLKDRIFNIEHVWKSREGLQREIIKLTRLEQK